MPFFGRGATRSKLFRHMMIAFLSIAIGRLSGVAFCIGGRIVSPREDRVAFFTLNPDNWRAVVAL